MITASGGPCWRDKVGLSVYLPQLLLRWWDLLWQASGKIPRRIIRKITCFSVTVIKLAIAQSSSTHLWAVHVKISWQRTLKRSVSWTEYDNVNTIQPNTACFQLATDLWGLPCLRRSRKEVAQQSPSVCGVTLRSVWRPFVIDKRVLEVPGCAVQAFLLTCAIMCTQPSAVAEELLVLAPGEKRLSGQQKAEAGVWRLEVLLCSYCLWATATCWQMDAVETRASSKAGVCLWNKLALKVVWN